MAVGIGSDLVFVCAANVCRSPLMELTFAARATQNEPGWRVTSRGVDVRRELPMCGVSRSLVDADSALQRRASEHLSAPLMADEIEAFDLIITASRAERAAVARLAPAARARTFTLLEATQLSAGLTTASNGAVRQSGMDLAEFVALLDAQRGSGQMSQVPLATGRSRRLLRGVSVDSLDLPDRHDLRGSRRHRQMLSAVLEVTTALHTQLSRCVQP